MIEFLLKGHEFFFGSNDKNHYKGKNVVLWLVTNLFGVFFEYVLNAYLELRNCFGFFSKPRGIANEKIVVSLTTFPARINSVWKVVDSIMRQNERPSRIQLWLSKMNFPKGLDELPKTLKRYVPYGLEICWVEDDLKPHKKYIYSFRMFSDKCVITVDDDIYYRKDLVKRLWSMHLKFPNAVCGNRGGQVVPKAPYHEWLGNYVPDCPSHKYYLTGCGGVLYPVHLFNKVSVDDVDKIRQTSLYTDDLWLKSMELLNSIPVVVGVYYSNGPTVIGSQKSALMSLNCDKNNSRNDESWKLLDKMFDVNQLVESFE